MVEFAVTRENQPILASLFADRKVCLAVIGSASIHLVLTALGLPSWQCPVLAITGVPCPGCGLSRACSGMFMGDWQKMLRYNAFAPLLALGLLVLFFGAVLPNQHKTPIQTIIYKIEAKTHIATILLFGLLLYWFLRLVIMQGAFLQLISGV